MAAGNSNDALLDLQHAQATMQSPEALQTQAYQQYGVPQQEQTVSGLRQAITNTTNLLNQVAPSVYGRTQNSLVTTAQAGRQIQNEQAPIAQNLEKQGQQYQGAQSDLDRALSKASQQAQLRQTGQQQQLENLRGIYSTLYEREQNELQRQLEERKYADSLRASSGGGGGGGGSRGGGSAAAGPTVQQRPGGGYNFQDANGKAISARTYAAQTGTDFKALLQQMAQNGDAGAKAYLNSGGKQYASALTWG